MVREALKKRGDVVSFAPKLRVVETITPDRDTLLKGLWAEFGRENTTAGKQRVWDRIGRVMANPREQRSDV